MILGIKPDGWLTIAAIVLGPLLAFQVQRWRDNRRERRNRKLEIYRRLMMTLKASMTPSHVDAINSIQVEFQTGKGQDEKVLDAWRLYTSHLNDRRKRTNAEASQWTEKQFDLLVDLVYLIGQSLGYKKIPKASLRDNTYLPQGFVDVEAELHQIRKGWLEVMEGTRPLTMTVLGPVQIADTMKRAEAIALPHPAPLAQLPPPGDIPPQE
jgi:hypothetical protein